VAATSGDVETLETTSTSFMTVAGLKKCIPTTSSGRDVTTAQSMTDSDVVVVVVVVARMAPGRHTVSSVRNSSCLAASSSMTASTTRSASPRSAYDVEPVNRPAAAAASSAGSLPRSTSLPRLLATAASTAAAFSWVRATNVTAYPALAKTSMMPVAIVPEPTTPTLPTGRREAAGTPTSLGAKASRTTCDEPGSA